MLNPSLINLLKDGESKYTLCMVTSKRARLIIDGAKPMVDTNSSKPVTIAIEEMLEGKLTFVSPTIPNLK